MTGFASINGQDVFAVYGIVFRPGTYAELLKAPKRKQGYQYNWGDEDGMETDPDETPVYERQVYNLPIFIQADNGAQFYQRYNDFKAFLYASREINFDFIEMGRRFKVRYADMSSFQKLTNIQGNGKVGCYFTLQLTDDYPTQIFSID